MKVKLYYLHSLQFGRWSTVLFRYYLLEGDTVVPSGLLARLCHVFLATNKIIFKQISYNVISNYRLVRSANLPKEL